MSVPSIQRITFEVSHPSLSWYSLVWQDRKSHHQRTSKADWCLRLHLLQKMMQLKFGPLQLRLLYNRILKGRNEHNMLGSKPNHFDKVVNCYGFNSRHDSSKWKWWNRCIYRSIYPSNVLIDWSRVDGSFQSADNTGRKGNDNMKESKKKTRKTT